MTTDHGTTPTAPAPEQQGLPPELMLQAMAEDHQAQLAALSQRCTTLYANVLHREQELAALRAEVAELRGANASPTT